MDTADGARANRTKPRDDDDDDDDDGDDDDDDDVPKPRRSSYTWDVLYIERETSPHTVARARHRSQCETRALRATFATQSHSLDARHNKRTHYVPIYGIRNPTLKDRPRREREREMMMMMVVYALRAVVYARAWCACARARGGGGGGGGGSAGASRRARGRRGGCRAS